MLNHGVVPGLYKNEESPASCLEELQPQLGSGSAAEKKAVQPGAGQYDQKCASQYFIKFFKRF